MLEEVGECLGLRYGAVPAVRGQDPSPAAPCRAGARRGRLEACLTRVGVRRVPGRGPGPGEDARGDVVTPRRRRCRRSGDRAGRTRGGVADVSGWGCACPVGTTCGAAGT